MATRACRDCGEEYRPEAQVSECPDCGGPIEWREEAPPTGGPADGPHRAVFGSDRPGDLESAVQRLGAASIPFVVRAGRRYPFEVWVPAEHAKSAAAQLHGLTGTMVRTEEDFDPEKGYGRCPACGAAVTGTGEDCPGCGLAVGPVDAVDCKHCGAPCPPDTESCPSCGC